MRGFQQGVCLGLCLALSACWFVGKDSADTDADTDTERTAFSCGELSCAPEEYCYHFFGGAQPDTGAVSNAPTCVAAPPECNGVPTCQCLGEVCSECELTEGVHCYLAAP